MKRYETDGDGHEWVDPEGTWVKYSEAQAELAQLRGLLLSAKVLIDECSARGFISNWTGYKALEEATNQTMEDEK